MLKSKVIKFFQILQNLKYLVNERKVDIEGLGRNVLSITIVSLNIFLLIYLGTMYVPTYKILQPDFCLTYKWTLRKLLFLKLETPYIYKYTYCHLRESACILLLCENNRVCCSNYFIIKNSWKKFHKSHGIPLLCIWYTQENRKHIQRLTCECEKHHYP